MLGVISRQHLLGLIRSSAVIHANMSTVAVFPGSASAPIVSNGIEYQKTWRRTQLKPHITDSFRIKD